MICLASTGEGSPAARHFQQLEPLNAQGVAWMEHESTRLHVAKTLLPSASCGFRHALSATARPELAQPFRICRDVLSVSMNDLVA
jgi:hypothetical protein